MSFEYSSKVLISRLFQWNIPIFIVWKIMNIQEIEFFIQNSMFDIHHSIL